MIDSSSRRLCSSGRSKPIARVVDTERRVDGACDGVFGCLVKTMAALHQVGHVLIKVRLYTATAVAVHGQGSQRECNLLLSHLP